MAGVILLKSITCFANVKFVIKTWYISIYFIYEIMTIVSTFKNDNISIVMTLITYNTHLKWNLFDLLLEILRVITVLRVITFATRCSVYELKCSLFISFLFLRLEQGIPKRGHG